jgi:hypothetical protein
MTPKKQNEGEKSQGRRRKSEERHSRIADRPRRPAAYRNLVSSPGSDILRVIDDLPRTIPIDDTEVGLAARMMSNLLDEMFPK